MIVAKGKKAGFISRFNCNDATSSQASSFCVIPISCVFRDENNCSEDCPFGESCEAWIKELLGVQQLPFRIALRSVEWHKEYDEVARRCLKELHAKLDEAIQEVE